MGTLYVTETGVQVHKEGQRLLVKRGSEVLQDIPMIKVDQVVLMGKDVSMTTPTLHALAQRKVGVYFLSKQGKFIVGTHREEHGHSRLRQAQTRASDDPARSLLIAQSIVKGKVNNQRVLVQRHAEGAPWSRSALAQMDIMRRQADASQTLDELRGHEGLAARDYFYLMRQILRPPSDGQSWGFERRTYYPPTDPINALLSFGYTLLLNNLIAACQISGLDPDIGFFHAIDYNKPAMALDLEEEFRPVIVDSIVLAAINRPIFGLRDFEIGQPWKKDEEEEDPPPSLVAVSNPRARPTTQTEKNGVNRPIYLKDTARKRFIGMYETRINEQITYPATGEQTSYLRIFELQAYAMARVILGEAEQYTPFTIR
ncbi:MAG: CRISPR-associated endonuclease Cas1 [Bacteroidales bacterium]